MEKKTKMRPRGGNSPVIGDNGLKVEPGRNAKYAWVLSTISKWPPVDKKDVSALEERLDEYLHFCMENDMKVGNQMCYLALGISKDDVYNWENGRTLGDQHSDFIKKVKKICGGYREILMQDGQVNPVTGIFWQKNYDGLKDQQDVVVSPGATIDYQDPATIEAKYKELPED